MHSNLIKEDVQFYRAHLGLTQVDMAKLVGVSLRTWTRWENGEQQVPEVAAKLLARLTGESR